MTPPAWIALASLAFLLLTAGAGGLIWLVRLESKTNANAEGLKANAEAVRATAEALSAHAKAQAMVAEAHGASTNENRIEIVRVQEQIKHLTSLVERWLVPSRTRRNISGEAS